MSRSTRAPPVTVIGANRRRLASQAVGAVNGKLISPLQPPTPEPRLLLSASMRPLPP